MKKVLIKGFLGFLFILFGCIAFAQDIIILKNGDEIKSKVMEVTPDIVKYKKWDNQDGPLYSSGKSEVFMIKYSNGMKDVFNTANAQNANTNTQATSSDGSKFIGTWYHKKYDGVNNQTLIKISKAMDNYLVEYKVHERVDEYFYDANGSFKEVGALENGSIIINSMTKLSLLNENTLLMGSKEFIKKSINKPSSEVVTTTNTNSPPPPTPSTVKVDINYRPAIAPISNTRAQPDKGTPPMSSDKATAELKKAKLKLDQGAITQAKYDSLKVVYTKYIK